MKANNTTNFIFLKDFKPELFKLAVKMEEDLLVTPISMLAYATRFLEYILYDIAEMNDYEVNRESGFVNNIYELIQRDYIEFYFGDLLIKAYHYRNDSIHNVNITKSLKKDRNTAFELNRRLFDIADMFYRIFTNDYEEHTYIEPKVIEKSKETPKTVIKKDKTFDKCIICGESNARTKSNFCTDCDNLLNYREVLTKIITQKGTNVLLGRDDFDYPFKKQMIDDLCNKNIIEQVGNKYNIVNDNMNEYFKLTDEFMDIDKFLADFINGIVDNALNSSYYLSNEYPYDNVSKRIDEHYAGEVVELMENGFSQRYSLDHVGITDKDLDNWYGDKKSELVNKNNDKLFIRYNELLIKDLFRSIEKQNLCVVEDEHIEFWSEYFNGFTKELQKILNKQKLATFVDLFKKGHKKIDALNESGLTMDEFDDAISIHRMLSDEYHGEVERRKEMFLDYVKTDSVDVSFKKAKLDRDDFDDNQKLTEILKDRYLDYRLDAVKTADICDRLTISADEIGLWTEDESFNKEYMDVRIKLFKKMTGQYEVKTRILDKLEITEDELNDYISRGKSGQSQFVVFYEYFQRDYYPNLIRQFLNDFSKTLNVLISLKNFGLTKEDLNKHLNSNKELYDEFMEIKVNKIVKTFINKGKINNKLLKKLDLTKKDYGQIEDDVNQRVEEWQLKFITNEVFKGELVLGAAKKVNCDIHLVFEWIFKGTLGNEKYSKFAELYWDEHLYVIDNLNSDIRNLNIQNVSRNKMVTANLKYDFDYWMKWGLLDGDNNDLSIEDVKEFLKKTVENNHDI